MMMKTIAVPVAWARETAGGLQVCYLQQNEPPETPWNDGGEWIPLYAAAPPPPEPADHLADPDSLERARNALRAIINAGSIGQAKRIAMQALGDTNAAPEQSERESITSPSQEGCAVGTAPAAAPVWSNCALSRCQASMRCEWPDKCQSEQNAAGQEPMPDTERGIAADRGNPFACKPDNAGNERPSGGLSTNSPVSAVPASTLPLSAEEINAMKGLLGANTLCDQALRAIELKKDLEVERAGNKAVYERAHMLEQQLAGLKGEWFRRGQESVQRKNESGCCCKIDDDDKILSACNAHDDWAKQLLAEKDKELEQTRKRFDQLLPGEHVWVAANETVKWPHCKVCGIILRTDRKNTPLCKGWTKIIVRAENAEAELAAANEQRIRDSIEVEKMLCDVLGRPWAASGFSIETLIRDIKAELAELKGRAR